MEPPSSSEYGLSVGGPRLWTRCGFLTALLVVSTAILGVPGGEAGSLASRRGTAIASGRTGRIPVVPGEPGDSRRHYVLTWPDRHHAAAIQDLHAITNGRHIELPNLSLARVRVRPDEHEEWIFRMERLVRRYRGEIFEDVSLPTVDESLPGSSEVTLPVVADGFPTDPWLRLLGRQALGPSGPPDFGINAIGAWSQHAACSSIRVMTIDSGVDLTHPDLAANLWTNDPEVNGIEGIDDDGNGYIDDYHGWNVGDHDSNVQDRLDECTSGCTFGHGTMTAGLIAAEANNRIGIAGICPAVELVTVRWRPPEGQLRPSLGGFLSALEYAHANDVKVINYSGSWYCDETDAGLDCGKDVADSNWSELMDLVGAKISELAADGVLIFTAFGNGGKNMDEVPQRGFPQSFEGAYGVAQSYFGGINPFANYGSEAVFVAPSAEIQSGPLLFVWTTYLNPYPAFGKATNYRCNGWPTDFLSGDPHPPYRPRVGCYRIYGGSSASTPLVAGTAALVWDANPTLTADEVIEILRGTGYASPALEGLTADGKIIDAGAAVAEAIRRRPEGTTR